MTAAVMRSPAVRSRRVQDRSAALPHFGPSPPGPPVPKAATPEESADIVKGVLVQITLEAERASQDVAEVAKLCHQKYGRGALTVHFESLAAARDGKCLTVDEWLKASIRRSSSYPFPRNKPVPEKVLCAARAFACDCAAEGQLGRLVIYRRAEKLIQQIPADAVSQSREALESYDPTCEVCVCGEVPAGAHDDVFTIAAKVPIESLVEKQQQQRKQWDSARDHVLRLKEWGNEEIKDKEVGTDLAAQTYREALRILLETKMEDAPVELALRLNLSEAVGRLGQWQESYEESCRALELDPTNVKALFRRGRALLQLGKPDEARQDLSRAAKAAPQDRRIREELEAARRSSVQPAEIAVQTQCRDGAGVMAVSIRHALSGARQLAVAMRGVFATQTSGLWRQLSFVAAVALLLRALAQWRRRHGLRR